jgi:ribonucleoside-diphosphate reductase alpha chain
MFRQEYHRVALPVMAPHPFEIAPVSRGIWDSKYRLKSADGTPVDADIEATWWRVARAAAAAEKGGIKVRRQWAERFHAVLNDFTFLPAGRIIAGAGTGRRVTLFNCFVMGRIEDDLGSIFDNVREAALTMQQGGGIGHDFSTLRPQGAPVRSTGSDASGPVSFMDVWDAMCGTIMSSGTRRGAMMGTMRCDHPDIERFIEAKAAAGKLRNFNLSVLVTDKFVDSVRSDAPWPLVFAGRTWRTIPARALWDRLMRATYDYAEPGVIFIDRINARNNLAYCESITATNPCGEQPLPAYGACLLGSINLARLVADPFTPHARLDIAAVEERTRLAIRFLDNCIDVSDYPLASQKREAHAKRRIGLGLTGLADALVFLGQRYGTDEAARTAETAMSTIQRAAYLASTELAAEKGAFPLCDRDKLLAAPNIVALPEEVRKAISECGLRNGCLTSIAPTGTISLLAGNVSSGVEPIFDLQYTRKVRNPDGSTHAEHVADYAYALHLARTSGISPAPEPTAQPPFVTTANLTPAEHLKMQAALQRHVDSSISKTINCPSDLSFESFKTVYLDAYDLGLKGCTTFRPNPITGSILTSGSLPPRPQQSVPEEVSAAVSAALSAAVPAVSPATQAQPLNATSPLPAAKPFAPAAAPQTPAVVYMSKPLERDPALAGYTYKLKWPGSDHAIYITINDIERDGRRRPFDIFINTKNLEHYAWTVALTRMISAVFRRGGDVTFVVEELKAVFDPQGGHWVSGRYVPSLLAAIGEVIEGHMQRIGFLQRETLETPGERSPRGKLAANSFEEFSVPYDIERRGGGNATIPTDPLATSSLAAPCPRCSRPDLIRKEGCWVCRSCGYSRCN